MWHPSTSMEDEVGARGRTISFSPMAAMRKLRDGEPLSNRLPSPKASWQLLLLFPNPSREDYWLGGGFTPTKPCPCGTTHDEIQL
jgi:hypothetical protein